MNDNCKSASYKKTKASYERRDAAMARLPSKVRDYILFDCPINFCAIKILSAYQGMSKGKNRAERFLALVKASVQRDGIKMYGEDHPNFS